MWCMHLWSRHSLLFLHPHCTHYVFPNAFKIFVQSFQFSDLLIALLDTLHQHCRCVLAWLKIFCEACILLLQFFDLQKMTQWVEPSMIHLPKSLAHWLGSWARVQSAACIPCSFGKLALSVACRKQATHLFKHQVSCYVIVWICVRTYLGPWCQASRHLYTSLFAPFLLLSELWFQIID